MQKALWEKSNCEKKMMRIFITFIKLMSNFLLDFLSLAAILSGILVITSKNPVISVLFLISVFVNVAGYLVLLGVGFIGISYLIVYVGAIAILFLFVVMMLNLQLAELSAVGKEYTQNLPLGMIVGSLFLFELVSILPRSLSNNIKTMTWTSAQDVVSQAELGILNWFNSAFLGTNSDMFQNSSRIAFSSDKVSYTVTASSADTHFANFLQIQSIGQQVYTVSAIWLLAAGIILLLAMVGPISLSMSKYNKLYYNYKDEIKK